MRSLLVRFLSVHTPLVGQIHQIRYCERFLELVIDVLSQLATRRYFKLLVSDQHFLEKCRLSPFGKYSLSLTLGEFRLFGKLLDMVEFYLVRCVKRSYALQTDSWSVSCNCCSVVDVNAGPVCLDIVEF